MAQLIVDDNGQTFTDDLGNCIVDDLGNFTCSQTSDVLGLVTSEF